MGGNVHTIKKYTEALVVAGKGNGLEVNDDKTKCRIISREHNVGQHPNIKTENKSFERMEQFRYLGTNLTNQNSIH